VAGQLALLLALPLSGQQESLTHASQIRNPPASGGRSNVLAIGKDANHKIKYLPIIPIRDLVADDQPARIRACVEDLRPDFFVARDFSGTVNVEYTNKAALSIGSVIDVSGYPTQRSNRVAMTRATIARLTNGDPALPVIHTIAQIRNLSVLQAARGFPVVVRGVATYYEADSAERLQFVQDGTAGIYIGVGANNINVFPAVGNTIEVLGFTSPGGFAPIIEAEAVRAIGPGSFPTALPASSQLLMTGAEDSQWIELNGVVRSATNTINRTLVALSTGDTVVQVIVLNSAHPVPGNFVGASIKARGVCRTLFDARRHLKGIGLCVPDWDQIEIREAEVADPFQLPLRPVSQLFEFQSSGYLHRSHVRGRIILRQRDGAFFLQDDSGGILVQADGAIPATDWVEVVGFPALKDQLPVLQDVLVRPVAPPATPPASPVRLSAESALDETLNATLVTLDGRVVAHSQTTTGETVTVQFAQQLTDAIMERSDREPLPRFVPGSTVQFTGVYMARLDNNRQIQSFQILLRSPADAVVISVPPWWTARHAIYVFGGLGGVILLSLAWVAGLRGQVRRRTTELRAEIEERKRMEAQVAKAHRELVKVSRQAGMAEVATSVLHNVGNVLNSVNVSAALLVDDAKKSSVARLGDALALLNEHTTDLGAYLTHDPKGKQVPGYLTRISAQLTKEQQRTIAELELIREHIEHIKEIVAMQQNYAKCSGVAEIVKVTDLVEDALRMNEETLTRHGIALVREYSEAPAMTLEKHKVLQILVNLIQNAKNALAEGGLAEKRLTLQVGRTDGGLARIAIIDNGTGIAPENLTRIFAHGFTTRKDGHGFGLHSGSLAAREMGGSLGAYSDGPGKGATFVLELPGLRGAHFQSGPPAKEAEPALSASVK
jgi:signal transduction histidine kinase